MFMNPVMISDNDEDHWSVKKQVQEFTEEDKLEVVAIFHAMAKVLAGKDNSMPSEYSIFAMKLKTLKAESAFNLLCNYLQYDSIQAIPKIKSFVYLKKLSDQMNDDNKILEKKLAKRVVLDMIHIVFYKTLPCPDGNHCKHYPRKIVHKNDFLDAELDCYFYHHEKDRRRFVLGEGEKEFRYAGNFSTNNKKTNNKSGFSLNFFESLYHPLYYKNFHCVRTKCDKSVLCPYNHSLEEKNIWAATFRNFFGKDREVYSKRRNSEEEKNAGYYSKGFSSMGSGMESLKRISILSSSSK